MKKEYEKFATTSGGFDVSDVGEVFRDLLREKAREYIIGVRAYPNRPHVQLISDTQHS